MLRVIARVRRPMVRDDAGLTLVEMITSMAIFLIIMGVVSTGIITGFRTIRDVTQFSDVQVQQQNALLWITRLLRYGDNPVEGLTPTPWAVAYTGTTDAAGNNALTFFTYSGTGPVAADRMPYKAQLRVDASGNLVSTVWTPRWVSNYGYCWAKTDNAACSAISEDIRTRVLVRKTEGHTPSFTLTYRTAAGQVTVPPATGDTATWRAWASAVDTVTVRIADTTPTNVVEQTVRLVNPR